MRRLLLVVFLVLCASVAFAATKGEKHIEPKFSNIKFRIENQKLFFRMDTNLPNGTILSVSLCNNIPGVSDPTTKDGGFIDAAAPLAITSPEKALSTLEGEDLKVRDGTVFGWFPKIYQKGMKSDATSHVFVVTIRKEQPVLGPKNNAWLSGKDVKAGWWEEDNTDENEKVKIFRQSVPVELPNESFVLPPHR